MPSATVLDINGQLKWKKESGFDAGKNAVLDDGEERFVWKIKSRTLYLNFETGEVFVKDLLKELARPILPEIAIMSFWPQTEKQILLFSMAKNKKSIKSVGRLLVMNLCLHHPFCLCCSLCRRK
jgi:hypothetical protein